MSIEQPHRHSAGGRVAVFVLLLAVVAGGVFAYRFLFHRAGEAAIQLIPGDAMLVVTLDTNPSPQQVAVFKRINDALKGEQLDTQFDAALSGAMQNAPLSRALRPYVKDSYALALLKGSMVGPIVGPNNGPNHGPNQAKTPDVVLFAALTDTAKANEILAQYGQKNSSNDLETYYFPQKKFYAAVVGSYLVLSERADPLARIQSVFKGETASVASLAEYRQARAVLPADANLMLFLSPSGLTRWQEEARTVTGVNPLAQTHWLTMSMTVRDQGLDMLLRIPQEAPAGSPTASISQITALDPALLHRLPAGAYGLMALSQPGKYWEWTANSVHSSATDPEAKKAFDEGLAAFERETGLNVPRDILPSLNGQFTLAVYPDAATGQNGVDGLVVVDAANGADPAALAAKIRAWVERESSNSKQPVHFVSAQRNGAVIWSLDESTQSQVRRSLGEALNSVGEMTGSAGGASVGGGTQNGRALTGMAQAAPEGRSPTDPALRDKTVAYAQVGKTLLLASSPQMLDRAIAAYTGAGRSLADDPAYAQMNAMLPGGPQSALMINLPGIMAHLRPFLARSMTGGRSPITADDYAQMFGTSGMVSSAKYDGKMLTMNFFLPLDYVRMIHIIGDASGGGTARPNGGNASSRIPPSTIHMQP